MCQDAISWGVMACVRLTEDDTTSSSRIFLKYLFQVREGWGGGVGGGAPRWGVEDSEGSGYIPRGLTCSGRAHAAV